MYKITTSVRTPKPEGTRIRRPLKRAQRIGIVSKVFQQRRWQRFGTEVVRDAVNGSIIRVITVWTCGEYVAIRTVGAELSCAKFTYLGLAF